MLDGIPYHTTYALPAPTTSQPDPNSAPLVVLIHALMASSAMYDSTTHALLSTSHRVLLYDHIGHGSSPAPPHQDTLFSFDHMTHHLHRLISNYTSSPPHVVIGCSMGGVLAVRYAILYPAPKYIMALGVPGFTALEEAKDAWSKRIEQFRADVKEGNDTLAVATAERWLPGNEERSRAARAKALNMTRRCSLKGYIVCADAIRQYDYTDQLSNVKAKVMIVIGERDTAVGSVNRLSHAAERIPGSQFVLMEGVGHLPPVHDEQRFEDLMMRFLKT